MDLVVGTVTPSSLAIERLVSLLTREATSFKGEVLTGLLLRATDAESARDEDAESARDEEIWAKLIEVANLIEDVVFKFIVKASQQPHQRGFSNLVGKSSRWIGTLNSQRNFNSAIQNIKALLLKINERGERYSFKESGGISRTIIFERYHSSPLIPEESIVGFDTEEIELIQKLTEGASRRSLILVAGAGGIGKTTLAKKVYDNELVKRHFDCRAWITVSQSYEFEELLKITITQFGGVYPTKTEIVSMPMEYMEEELVITLGEFLYSKRYMIVFDDVRNDRFWHSVKHAFPDNYTGNRIIITMRNETVGASFEESPCHVRKLEPLSQTMSWQLFCRTAFEYHDPQFCCPPELEELSLELVRICQGLPLAIVVIAGVLKRKQKNVFLGWQKLLDYSSDEDNSVSVSNSQWNNFDRLSFSSGQISFFSDDIED